MTDKRMTVDEAVAEVADGMTIGIGGWGSRRKPMAFVRALVRKGVGSIWPQMIRKRVSEGPQRRVTAVGNPYRTLTVR